MDKGHGKPHVLRKSIVLFFITIFILSFPRVSLGSNEDDPKINIVYFYENVCESCNPEEEFIELFSRLVGDERKGVNVEFLMYNTFHSKSLKIMENYIKDFSVPKEEQSKTMVFIGQSYLSGQRDIESHLKDEFIKAKEHLKKAPGHGPDMPIIQYFHVTACNSCSDVDKFLDTLQGVEIQDFNISDPENLELIKAYFDAYDVPEESQSVPIVFIGDTYLWGKDDIVGLLVQRLEEGHASAPPRPIEVKDKVHGDDLSGYGIVGVLLTGLINGLNPCSISMLLFFFSLLTIKNVSALKMGFSFIAGKFITYFLLGTLLFNIFARLNIPWFQTGVKVIMAIILLIMALYNIMDLWAARREEYNDIKMQLPVFLRKKNHQWIKKVASMENSKILMPMSFGLGALISAGEFLCTGQIYLATIISVLHESKTLDIRAIVYFIIYGLAFVFPLILLTIFVHKGREIFDLTEWMRERMPLIKLINAIIFILFAVIMLIWF